MSAVKGSNDTDRPWPPANKILEIGGVFDYRFRFVLKPEFGYKFSGRIQWVKA